MHVATSKIVNSAQGTRKQKVWACSKRSSFSLSVSIHDYYIIDMKNVKQRSLGLLDQLSLRMKGVKHKGLEESSRTSQLKLESVAQERISVIDLNHHMILLKIFQFLSKEESFFMLVAGKPC